MKYPQQRPHTSDAAYKCYAQQSKRPHTSAADYERNRFRNPRFPHHKLQSYKLNETLDSQRYPVNTITGLSMYPQGYREKGVTFNGISLLDIPICAVHDDGHFQYPPMKYAQQRPHTSDAAYKRYAQQSKRPHTSEASYDRYRFRDPHLSRHKLQFYGLNETLNSNRYAVDTITGLSMYPHRFLERASTSNGMIPLTDTWRDELREITERVGLGQPVEPKEPEEPPKRTSVYSADTGRLIPPPSRCMSRGFSRQKQRRDAFLHIASDQDNEQLVLEMLCQILQTDSIAAVQSWLVSSGQREKDLVLDMITSAISSEEAYWTQQQDKQDFYDNRGQTSRPRTNNDYIPSTADAGRMGNGMIPEMMNVQNGYGELDRPVPPSRDGGQQTNGYSRYSYSRDGERRTPRTAGGTQMETIYDEQADHPALKKPSSKPDIFKVNHDAPTGRTQSQAKAEIMKLVHPASPHPPQSQDISTPPPKVSSGQPKVRYTKSALDIRDEDLKKHTLASILKDDKSVKYEKSQ